MLKILSQMKMVASLGPRKSAEFATDYALGRVKQRQDTLNEGLLFYFGYEPPPPPPPQKPKVNLGGMFGDAKKKVQDAADSVKEKMTRAPPETPVEIPEVIEASQPEPPKPEKKKSRIPILDDILGERKK